MENIRIDNLIKFNELHDSLCHDAINQAVDDNLKLEEKTYVDPINNSNSMYSFKVYNMKHVVIKSIIMIK